MQNSHEVVSRLFTKYQTEQYDQRIHNKKWKAIHLFKISLNMKQQEIELPYQCEIKNDITHLKTYSAKSYCSYTNKMINRYE